MGQFPAFPTTRYGFTCRSHGASMRRFRISEIPINAASIEGVLYNHSGRTLELWLLSSSYVSKGHCRPV